MNTTKFASLLAVPLLLTGELFAQNAERGPFSISGTAGYYGAIAGSVFDGEDAGSALGYEGALRYEFLGYLGLGAVVQYVNFPVSGGFQASHRSFTSVLLEGHTFARNRNIDLFFGLRAGVGYQRETPGDGGKTGLAWGGVLGMRYWFGSNFAIELGAGLTSIEYFEQTGFGPGVADSGRWLSLSVGVTAALPGGG
jgi:hypothetical protein